MSPFISCKETVSSPKRHSFPSVLMLCIVVEEKTKILSMSRTCVQRSVELCEAKASSNLKIQAIVMAKHEAKLRVAFYVGPTDIIITWND